MKGRNFTRAITIAVEVAIVIGVLWVLFENMTMRRRLKAVSANCAPRFSVRGSVPSLPLLDLNGRPTTLDLTSGRFTVAVVDPSCQSCEAVMQEAQSAPDVVLVSIVDVAQTKEHVARTPLRNRTFVLNRAHIPREFFGGIPQLFVVDRGTIVRTCASVRECS